MKKTITLFIFLMMTFVIHAQIIHIPSDYPTIQAGIDASNNGDTVLVSEGTYFENINFNGKAIMLASEFLLDGDESHITKTIIDGSQAVDPDKAAVVRFENCMDTTSVLNGFSITGGKGFIVSNEVRKLRVGGGILCALAGGKIINNRVYGNSLKEETYWCQAGGIGAFIFDQAFNIIIRNNQVFDNHLETDGFTAGAGIAVMCENGSIEINNNQIYSNTATTTTFYKAIGGGLEIEKVYAGPGKIVVKENYIHHNELHCQSTVGGGIYMVYYRDATIENLETNIPVEFINNIISDNYAEDQGGGFAIWNMANYYGLKQTVSDPVIINNTIINNRSANGVGIFNYDAEAVLINNIISNDLSAENSQEIYNEDVNYPGGWAKNKNEGIIHYFFNLISDYHPGIGNIKADPGFQPDTFLLSVNSPCVGRGMDSVSIDGYWFHAPRADYHGTERLLASVDHKIDMGAIESLFNKALNAYDSETVINVPAEQPTIQAGINAAFDGDTVLVEEGYYYENINFKGKAITVASNFLMDGDDNHIGQTVIDGSLPSHSDTASVVFIGGGLDSTTVLSGFTITGGKGTKSVRPTGTKRIGGGVFIELSGAKVENNIVTANLINEPNYEVAGGGIFGVNNEAGQNLVIRNNRIFNNHIKGPTYTQGGGVLVAEPYGSKLIENNDIFQNTATCTGNYKANGGGITIGTWEPWNTQIIVRNNRIYENEIHCVASQGGGIFLTFPKWGNETHAGKSQIEINNNLIANNYSEDRGGAIGIWDQGNKAYDIEDPNPLIYNNTIVGNTAFEAGGIFNFEMNALLMNNIISNNGKFAKAREISLEDIDYIYGPYTNHGKFQSYYNDINRGWPGAGNIDKDPKTDPDDFMLEETSPCIGRGIDSVHINGNWYYAPAYDLEGVNRLMASTDGEIDMGALESPYDRLDPVYNSEHIINVPEEESTIQAAIDATGEGDTVLVAPGLYYENINYRGKAITVMSHYGMDKKTDHQTNTVIDGSLPLYSDTAAVVTFSSGEDTTSIIMGFTITGGKGNEVEAFPGLIVKGGGGIHMLASGGKIENNIVTGNKVESTSMQVAGGGIVGGEGGHNIIIRNNIVKNNEIISPWSMGAGIRISSDEGYNLIEGNEISYNKNTCTSWYKASGGGMLIQKQYASASIFEIKNNFVHHNELHCQSSVGGGIYIDYPRDDSRENLETNNPILLENNIISENYSQDQGGGIAIWNLATYYGLKQTVPDPILINNTIINNRSANGGGIFNYDAEAVLINNIISNDLSAENCQEIYNEDVIYPGGWAKNKNEGTIHSFYNLISDSSPGQNTIMADPGFKQNSFELDYGSPCIGAGTAMVEVNGVSYYAPSFDYNGNPRPNPIDILPDIGAIESEMMTGMETNVLSGREMQVYPNPAEDIVTIGFNLHQKTQVRLSIINILGQEERILLNEVVLPGETEISFDTGNLRDGIYIVRLVSDKITSKKLIVR